jgi:hypothetical protein
MWIMKKLENLVEEGEGVEKDKEFLICFEIGN